MDAFAGAAAVAIVLWAASFLYFRAYLARRTGSERILSEFRDEVEKLVSEIDAAADRDARLVEDRVKSLRSLLEEADKRLAVLRRELDRRSTEERAYAELGKRPRPLPLFPGMESSPPAAAPPPADLPRPAPTRSVPAGSPQPEIAAVPPPPVRGPAPAPAEPQEAAFIRARMQVAPKEPPFAERVAELHRAGFSAEIIANRLGKTVGEVELTIALGGRTEAGDGREAELPRRE